MRIALAFLALALPLATASAAPVPTVGVVASCDVRMKVINSLGNFEIQDLMSLVVAATVDGKELPQEAHTLSLRVPPKGEATVSFTIRSDCATRRTLKVRRVLKQAGAAQPDFITVTLPARPAPATTVDAVVRIDR